MFENAFIILVTSSPYDDLKGTEWYRLIETREYKCVACGDWNTVTKAIYNYVKRYSTEQDFFSALNNLDNRRPSPATREQTEFECEIEGDLFDYDIDRIIRKALYDSRYGNSSPVRLPKRKVMLGLSG